MAAKSFNLSHFFFSILQQFFFFFFLSKRKKMKKKSKLKRKICLATGWNKLFLE